MQKGSAAHVRLVGIIVSLACLLSAAAQTPELPIGAIQGAAAESPYLNRFVAFRGVVVGRYEDQNTRGDIYYTLFVQDESGVADGDPATSDGVAVFLGRIPRPDVALGDRVYVGGKVTEFYGLTEIDDNGLTLSVEGHGALPDALPLDPPAAVDEAAVYFEALEGMRVAIDRAVVAGPTHEGCGFAIVAEGRAAELPIIRRAENDPTGRAVPVLLPSDVACDDAPQLKMGDRLSGVAGALTYNFDQFKIVLDAADQLAIEPAAMPAPPTLPTRTATQIAIATLNAEDAFDTTRDTAEEGEPVLTAVDLARRQAKLTHLIANTLACPTLIGLQEVEHAALLDDLAAALAVPCGYVYDITHRETPDTRGIDNALLSDPRRVRLDGVTLRQTCSAAPTDVTDPALACSPGEYPLFGRPPLEVEATIDGQPYTLWINHFKSKRDGEAETGLQRIQQAVYLNGLAAAQLDAQPDARLIALGDFNDTDRSPVMALLAEPGQGGQLSNALAGVPDKLRYSYVFGGVAELIDGILVSPALTGEIGLATIVHVNANYPVGWRLDTSAGRIGYRTSDHDVPVVILGHWPTPTPTADLRLTPAASEAAMVASTPTTAPTVTAAPAVASEVTPAAMVTNAAPTPLPPVSDSAGWGLRFSQTSLLLAAVVVLLVAWLMWRLTRR